MEMTRLAPRARSLFYLQAFVRLVLFWLPITGVGISLTATVLPFFWAVVVGLGWLFLLFLGALWMPALSHARWGYAIRDEDLLITRGVLIRSVVAIPTARIQHVDTRQGPFEQSLRLARVRVHTASGLGADGVIPGLELRDAEELRDRLMDIRGDGGV
jgi:uncharacterized protein